MKTSLLKPGFEFIFSLSLIVILGLPPVLMAQNQKDLEIRIENGDTVINGKNIKELSAKDRKNALRDIKHLNGGITINSSDEKGGRHMYFFKRKDTLDGKNKHFSMRLRKMENGDRQTLITENMEIRDSLGNVVEVRPGTQRRMELRDGNPERRLRSLLVRFDQRNSQNFNYVNTDNEGISTHVSFHVSEASDEDLKRIPHIEGAKFEISDLNIVPEFTSGKILLMFNLPSKAAAEVKLHDSEGKLMWSEKSTGGSFSKTFALGLNGIYYLQVKQGNNTVVKRITKEE